MNICVEDNATQSHNFTQFAKKWKIYLSRYGDDETDGHVEIVGLYRTLNLR